MHRHTLARAALLGMLLRIAVPAGFMPADVAGGWYLQLCPDGVPASVVAALLGHAHHVHEAAPDAGFLQCELGGGLSGSALLERPADPPSVSVSEWFDVPAAFSARRPGALSAYHSRAPPVPRLPS